MDNLRVAIMSLKLIAAKAEKLAYDLEHNKLWEGDLIAGTSEIQAALQDVKRVSSKTL